MKLISHTIITPIGHKTLFIGLLLCLTSCNFCALEPVLTKKSSRAEIVNSTDDTIWIKESNTNERSLELETYVASGASVKTRIIFGSDKEDYDPIRVHLTESVYTSASTITIFKNGYDTIRYQLNLSKIDDNDKGYFKYGSWKLKDPDLCNRDGICDILYTIEDSDFQ